MSEHFAEAEETVLDDELLFDDVRREPAPRRDDLVREGEVLAGKYRVERIPGRNGLGVLVQVRHVELGQEVTLKFLVPDACIYPEFVQRFIREARAAVKIQGEHVARVTDVGRLESGAPYMVREFLRGPDLAEVVKVRGALPFSEACDYIIQAAEAVAEGHALGIAHRNLRPTTLVVTRRTDGAPLVKVFDFAATEALHVEPFTKRSVSLVGSSALMASLPYLSPEQVRDPHGVDFRADVYALGAVLYELLAGVPPFEAESAPALLAMVAADLPTSLGTLRPDLPPRLEQVVMRCLAKSRDQRFDNIAELSLALRPYTSGESTGSIDRIVRLASRTTRLLADTRISTSTIPVAVPVASSESSPPGRSYAPTTHRQINVEGTSLRREEVRAAAATSSPLPVEVRPPAAAAPAPEPTIGSPFAPAPSANPPARFTPRFSARARSGPPPLQAQPSVPVVQPSAAEPPTPSVPPPPHAPSSTKTTMMPPARSRSSLSWGMSQSWAAPPPERAPLPLKKLAAVGALATCSAFILMLVIRHGSGAPAAATQPPAAPLPAQLTAAPAPVAVAPPAAAESAAASASVQASAAPIPPAVAAPAVAAPAAPVARSVAPGPKYFTPPAAKPRAAQAPAAEAPRAPAKVAAAAPAKAKNLFSDPD